MSTEYETCKLERAGQGTTVTIVPPRALPGATADLHWDLGEIVSDLRSDDEARVVVLTGRPASPTLRLRPISSTPSFACSACRGCE
jgi:enoyl-CoA hydratase/carnithine racemase